MISVDNLHFNSRLLVKELLSRGVLCSQVQDTSMIEASLGEHKEIFDGTTTSLIPSVYQAIFDDKGKTKILLQSKGFCTSSGNVFEGNAIDDAIKYAQACTFPLVIKPNIGTHGYQVRMNIDDTTEFEDIFYTLSREIHSREILVEEQFFGQEYRLTITKTGFFAAVHRTFPYVIGNDENNILELVAKINMKRMEDRKNCLCRIWLDKESERFLQKQGKDFSYVPGMDEMVFIRSNSNVSTGGGCIDITDNVHPFFKDIADKILKSFSNLPYVGIDLMTKNISEPGEYIICELNSDPGLSLHTHPEIGESRDIVKDIVDMLFPETKSKITTQL